MLTVHHLRISQSERIVWLCEERGIPYTLKRYDRDPVTRRAPIEYKALHPMEMAPVITDGELVLAESGAIIDYLLARHGHGGLKVDADAPNFTDYLFWFHFANGTLMPSNMVDLVTRRMLANAGQEPPRRSSWRGEQALAVIEARLGEADYFAGPDFTAADIMMVFPLTTMRAFLPRDLGDYPHIRAYLARIGGRPAYQRAMAVGDPGFTPLLQ